MFCMKCGTELPDTADFCYKCGTKTITVPSNNKSITGEYTTAANKKGSIKEDILLESVAQFNNADFFYKEWKNAIYKAIENKNR